jgi:hypothetical protein
VRGNVAFWHIARSKDNQAFDDITAYDLMTIMDKLTSLRAFRESGRTRQLLALYPELRIHLVLSDEQIDPVQGGYDVTLRIADLEDSSLIARKIVAIDRVICAVPSYLDEHGVPKHPGDLRRHALLGFLLTGNQWKLTGVDAPCAGGRDATLPSAVGDIAYQNKALIYDLLFKASSERMLRIAADPKHLGARFGITSVLHTWGRQ